VGSTGGCKAVKEIEAKKNKKLERKLGKGVVGWLKAKLSGVSWRRE
jgi:hypothetical protein